MKRGVVLILLGLLAACAAPPAQTPAERAIAHWLGHPIAEVVAAWGPPAEERSDGGRQLYVWPATQYGRSYYPANLDPNQPLPFGKTGGARLQGGAGGRRRRHRHRRRVAGLRVLLPPLTGWATSFCTNQKARWASVASSPFSRPCRYPAAVKPKRRRVSSGAWSKCENSMVKVPRPLVALRSSVM